MTLENSNKLNLFILIFLKVPILQFMGKEPESMKKKLKNM